MTEKIMKSQKRIALIAHDQKKDEMVAWCMKHKEELGKHFLCGTGTTSKLISEATNLPVKAYKSGPMGGDQQIGARIAEGEIDMMIFFWDPLEAQPHDPDIRALLRIAVVYDIPVATNSATADFIVTSQYMNSDYTHETQEYRFAAAQKTETEPEINRILKSER